jgi:membrane associated rhomboid family serine protease
MNRFSSSPFENIPPVVKNLIIINVIFFVATLVIRDGNTLLLKDWLSVYYFDSPKFRVWQLVSYMFMHSPQGFGHIFFNMFGLLTIGGVVEQALGSKRFFNFYLLTGLGAVALQMVIQAIEVYGITGGITIDLSTYQSGDALAIRKLSEIYSVPMMGASGAIFGIFIAFAMLLPNAELMIFPIPIPVKAKFLMPLYILVELYLGVMPFVGDSVAHFAHLGGALFGFILIKLWGIQRPGRFL